MARGLMEYNGWYKVKKEEECLRRNVMDKRRSGAWVSLLFKSKTNIEVCFSRDLNRREVDPNQNIITLTLSISTIKPKVSNGTMHRFC